MTDDVEKTSRGGATGIPAAVLAVLGGLTHLIGVAGGAVMLAGDGDLGRAMLTFLLHLIVAGLLLIGGIGLAFAKPFGRIITIAGSAVALLQYLSVVLFGGLGIYFVGLINNQLAGYIAVLCVPAVATLVLASVPPTARWVTSGWS